MRISDPGPRMPDMEPARCRGVHCIRLVELSRCAAGPGGLREAHPTCLANFFGGKPHPLRRMLCPYENTKLSLYLNIPTVCPTQRLTPSHQKRIRALLRLALSALSAAHATDGNSVQKQIAEGRAPPEIHGLVLSRQSFSGWGST